MKIGIKYKDTKAMPGSDLYKLLTDAEETKNPAHAKELRKKAEQVYQETEARYRKSMGQ
jgi:hypothetical protein